MGRFCSHGQQFLDSSLNIAGVGPIFGPILGALYTDGSFSLDSLAIFAGAVHDYLTGMISMRYGGAHLPALASLFLGKYFSHVVNFFTVLLLLLVGTVFISAPASMIDDLIGKDLNMFTLIVIYFCILYHRYNITIDKIIGKKIYPVLGLLLLLSAVGVAIGMFMYGNQFRN
jgi:carbon starvation protein CstA